MRDDQDHEDCNWTTEGIATVWCAVGLIIGLIMGAVLSAIALPACLY